MANSIKITQGLDIQIKGEANKEIAHIEISDFAIKPTDFIGVLPKLLVKEGDTVKAGTPIFMDKLKPEVLFTSPVSGSIETIVRGDKRVLEEIRIKATPGYESEDFGKINLLQVGREELIEKLLKSGCWTMIRQRPYSVIANPNETPRDIYVSAFDTAPLAPDYSFILKSSISDFQAGIDALKVLSGKNVKLGLLDSQSAFSNINNADITYYSGPHPAGNISTQIGKTAPINKGDVVWYVNPQDLVIIGRLCNTGLYNTSITISVCGSEVVHPQYFTTRKGACIKPFVAQNTKEGSLRFISGNVLTGTKIQHNGYLSFYHNQFTIIPEGDEYELFGWALPGLGKYSFSKSFFSWLNPNKKYTLNANFHGGHRALVLTGQFEKVIPLDIYPMHLIKACIAENVDQMERLGIYEVDEEDFALAEFIDPSKTEIQTIIRNGLNLIRKEMN